jgi:hypothetical protein
MKVTVIDGYNEVHRPGCADLKRNRTRQAVADAFTVEVEDTQGLAEDLWGDIASDYGDEGWAERCMEYLNTETRIYPCVSIPERKSE